MSGDRRLILVVGPGRSGTSLVTAMLRGLGYHVPQPEFAASDGNPRGYHESVWVYRFHEYLLRHAGIRYIAEHDPAQFRRCEALAGQPKPASILRAWLESCFRQSPAVVVKDPRTAFFLPAWQRAADEFGIDTRYVCMLRNPLEVVGSQTRYYQPRQAADDRLAAWIVTVLQTERFTRTKSRLLILFQDLLENPARVVDDLIRLAPPAGSGSAEESLSAVDPSLHRVRGDAGVHVSSEELLRGAAEIWSLLEQLAGKNELSRKQILAALDRHRVAIDRPR